MVVGQIYLSQAGEPVQRFEVTDLVFVQVQTRQFVEPQQRRKVTDSVVAEAQAFQSDETLQRCEVTDLVFTEFYSLQAGKPLQGCEVTDMVAVQLKILQAGAVFQSGQVRDIIILARRQIYNPCQGGLGDGVCRTEAESVADGLFQAGVGDGDVGGGVGRNENSRDGNEQQDAAEGCGYVFHEGLLCVQVGKAL